MAGLVFFHILVVIPGVPVTGVGVCVCTHACSSWTFWYCYYGVFILPQAMQLSLMESGRRNTRSNGASQQSKKGLRSGKAYKSSESGSGEEESGTDTESSDDSTYADKEMHMSKLQVTRAVEGAAVWGHVSCTLNFNL